MGLFVSTSGKCVLKIAGEICFWIPAGGIKAGLMYYFDHGLHRFKQSWDFLPVMPGTISLLLIHVIWRGFQKSQPANGITHSGFICVNEF